MRVGLLHISCPDQQRCYARHTCCCGVVLPLLGPLFYHCFRHRIPKRCQYPFSTPTVRATTPSLHQVTPGHRGFTEEAREPHGIASCPPRDPGQSPSGRSRSFNLLIASRSTGVGEDATVVSPVVTSKPARLHLANPFSCPNQRDLLSKTVDAELWQSARGSNHSAAGYSGACDHSFRV